MSVVIETTKGIFTVDLYTEQRPKSKYNTGTRRLLGFKILFQNIVTKDSRTKDLTLLLLAFSSI
jgi:hypothetical protein